MQPYKKTEPKAPMITIIGDPGMAKTTLACMFPGETFVVRAEDGLESIPLEYQPDTHDVIENEGMLWSQLKYLCEAEHPYNNVVLDSVSKLESIFIQSILKKEASNGKDRSIQTALGGFGAGTAAVASKHLSVRTMLGKINARGITVIVISHCETEEISPPDGEKYTRWSLKLGKKSIAPYVDDVDMVCFIKLDKFIMQQEGGMPGKAGKAKDTGTLSIVCNQSAANISKNRYGIKDEIPYPENGTNPLLPFIPFYAYLFETTNEAQQ